jgi:hypothetical protein
MLPLSIYQFYVPLHYVSAMKTCSPLRRSRGLSVQLWSIKKITLYYFCLTDSAIVTFVHFSPEAAMVRHEGNTPCIFIFYCVF